MSTLLVGALMGAVALVLVYLGASFFFASRARTYGPLKVVGSQHGFVVLQFDAEQSRGARGLLKSMIGGDQTVTWFLAPEQAFEFGVDVATTAYRAAEQTEAEDEAEKKRNEKNRNEDAAGKDGDD